MPTAQRRTVTTVAPQSGEHHLTRDEAARALALMVAARELSGQLARLRREAKIPVRPDAACREGLEVGTGMALGPRDRLYAPARFVAAHFARGVPAGRLVAIARGNADRARKVPRGVPNPSIGASATVPDLVPMAVGAALGARTLGKEGVVVAPCDRESVAASYPELQLAAERRLPLVLVLDDRDDGEPVPAGESVIGLAAEPAPAADVEAIFGAVRRALARAREGAGPVVVACRDIEVEEGPRHKRFRRLDRTLFTDPVELFAVRLSAHGFSRAEINRIRAAAERDAVDAVDPEAGTPARAADPLLDASGGVLEGRAA